MNRTTLAKVTVCVLTVAGAISVYQTLFCLWMSSHPLYHSPEWTTRFYIRLSTTIVVAVLWLLVGIWLLKHRSRSMEPTVGS
jgi:hypothetical protein